jgi:phosphoglycolate phosphatase-like HAD superfamily hydrolase
MFDLDGTLSLIRSGWMPLMLDMMMETLGLMGLDPAALRDEAEDYVARLTGKDTVYQMEAFARHVEALGGVSRPASEYKELFLQRLDLVRNRRIVRMERDGDPESMLVPGSRTLIETLRAEGLRLFLASGTAHHDVCEEAKLLRIDGYFEGIYGSAPDSLTKRQLLAKLVDSGLQGAEILTFGDGPVEIEETKHVGGTAVGVASDEPECLRVEEKKRGWLARAGADYIIPNYLEAGLVDLVKGLDVHAE